MYDQIKTYILSRIQIPEGDLQKAFQYSDIKYFKKGDYVIRIGEYCRFIGFINSGLIVGLIIDDGKEIACNFTYENCFYHLGQNNGYTSERI
jgi:hypothetical protein